MMYSLQETSSKDADPVLSSENLLLDRHSTRTRFSSDGVYRNVKIMDQAGSLPEETQAPWRLHVRAEQGLSKAEHGAQAGAVQMSMYDRGECRTAGVQQF